MIVRKNNLWKHLVFLLILFVTIGYAYLSTTLSINGTANFKGNTWDIHFENVVVSDDSVTADEPTLANGATKLSFSVNLQKPGDRYEFTVDVVNAGTIDAMINMINKTTLTGEAANYAELSFAYADGSKIKEKDLLEYNSSKTIKVIISFKEDIDEDDLPSDNQEIDVELEIEYVQADETAFSSMVTYYEFGEPTASSTTDYTTLNKNVFISLRGGQKSVCIITNGNLECFKNNNVDEEVNHLYRVFGDDVESGNAFCVSSSGGYNGCTNSNLELTCQIYDGGSVLCYNYVQNYKNLCSLDSGDNVLCDVDVISIG